MLLLLSIIFLVVGFILIYLSADQFIENSAKIANFYKIKPLIIGIVILGFGTSAPEMLVSGVAAFKEHPGLSVGNAFGSNIFNIALVLGITAIMRPIKVELKNIQFEWLILIAFTGLAGFLLLYDFDSNTFDGSLSTGDGFCLLGLLGIFLWYTFKESKKAHHEFDIPSSNAGSEQKWKLWRDLVFWMFLLVGSAQVIVVCATYLADYYHVSDLIFGLTVVALGTSIPELAVSVRGAYKNQHEMVVGNIIGSNIFNTVAVLAIPSLISPIKVLPEKIYIDYIFMLFLTFLIGIFIRSNFLSRPSAKQITDKIDDREGLFLVIILIIYFVLRIYFWK